VEKELGRRQGNKRNNEVPNPFRESSFYDFWINISDVKYREKSLYLSLRVLPAASCFLAIEYITRTFFPEPLKQTCDVPYA
jgi:hypothetical protein